MINQRQYFEIFKIFIILLNVPANIQNVSGPFIYYSHRKISRPEKSLFSTKFALFRFSDRTSMPGFSDGPPLPSPSRYGLLRSLLLLLGHELAAWLCTGLFFSCFLHPLLVGREYRVGRSLPLFSLCLSVHLRLPPSCRPP